MSAEQTRRTINQLDKEIAALSKKAADYEKNEAVARGNASRTAKSISKNASLTTIKSKQAQIERYNDSAVKASNAKADLQKKIATKQKQKATAQTKLQREEAAEHKKIEKAQVAVQRGYERRMDELTEQLNAQITADTPTHLYSENNAEEYDVFISHASEDKGGFVNELYQELTSRDVKVWYDAITIGWGDSLRKKIDDGLRKSRFGIVVLSNDYIRKGWTQYELDGLFQREMTGGKTILPIWHKITKDEVQTLSMSLAGRKALNTAMLSAAEIADELIKLLPKNIQAESIEIEEDTRNAQQQTKI
jgi:hypothetical protein